MCSCFLNLDSVPIHIGRDKEAYSCSRANEKFTYVAKLIESFFFADLMCPWFLTHIPYRNVILLLVYAFIETVICTWTWRKKISCRFASIHHNCTHIFPIENFARLCPNSIDYIFTQRKLLDGIRALNWKEFSRGGRSLASARPANSASSSRSMTKSRLPINVARHMFSSFIRERTNISSVKRCSSCASGK